MIPVPPISTRAFVPAVLALSLVLVGLDVVHEFVLPTPVLPEDARQALGLEKTDTKVASDHLPVVIDVQAP